MPWGVENRDGVRGGEKVRSGQGGLGPSLTALGLLHLAKRLFDEMGVDSRGDEAASSSGQNFAAVDR